MGLTCDTHLKNCTVKNALLWGMCRSHIEHARKKNHLHERITHLVLAILEAIPVMGQIISLIERKLILSRKQPLKLVQQETVKIAEQEPAKPVQQETIKIVEQEQIKQVPPMVPCVPPFETIEMQESPEDIRRIWPKDLQKLGISEAQRIEVDGHIREAFKSVFKGEKLEFSKNSLKYTDGENEVNAVLPFSLSIAKENQEGGGFKVLLLPKSVFAQGGERKIHWAYDLTKGNYLLRKRIAGSFENQILNYMRPLRDARGIQAPVIWLNSVDKHNKPKKQIIEPVRDGTIAALFKKAPLADFSTKRALMVDLLSDLQDLHQGELEGVVISPAQLDPFGEKQKKLNYHLFHADIKPENILVHHKEGNWRAELIDFGQSAANPTAYVISLGYTPPEYIRFYSQVRPLGIHKEIYRDDIFKISDFNIQHGQGRDVWSLGLVILSLLAERQQEVIFEHGIQHVLKKANIPPLPCLGRILSGRIYTNYDEALIVNLKQKDLDADLDQLEMEIALKHPQDREEIAKIFQMLKEKMLRIDPKERKPIGECLALFQQEMQKAV